MIWQKFPHFCCMQGNTLAYVLSSFNTLNQPPSLLECQQSYGWLFHPQPTKDVRACTQIPNQNAICFVLRSAKVATSFPKVS